MPSKAKDYALEIHGPRGLVFRQYFKRKRDAQARLELWRKQDDNADHSARIVAVPRSIV